MLRFVSQLIPYIEREREDSQSDFKFLNVFSILHMYVRIYILYFTRRHYVHSLLCGPNIPAVLAVGDNNLRRSNTWYNLLIQFCWLQ